MSELTTLFKNTADAIRSKTGDTATMKASQFPAKIQGISVGISQDEADARYLQLSGGTMTGDLILNGAPTSDNQAATKAYVDSKSGNGDLIADVSGTLTLSSKITTTAIKIQLTKPAFNYRQIVIEFTPIVQNAGQGRSWCGITKGKTFSEHQFDLIGGINGYTSRKTFDVCIMPYSITLPAIPNTKLVGFANGDYDDTSGRVTLDIVADNSGGSATANIRLSSTKESGTIQYTIKFYGIK